MFFEEKIDRIITLLEQIAGAKPAAAKKETKPKDSVVLPPAAGDADPFATTGVKPPVETKAETKTEPVTREILGATLTAYSKTAKEDTAGYALVAALFESFKKADGTTVKKFSELQSADYNAAFEAAKAGIAKAGASK
jgi:hypothetical protein